MGCTPSVNLDRLPKYKKNTEFHNIIEFFTILKNCLKEENLHFTLGYCPPLIWQVGDVLYK